VIYFIRPIIQFFTDFRDSHNMLFSGIKTYLKEIVKLKYEYPNYFDIVNLVNSFPRWQKSLNSKSSPLQEEQPWITFSAIDFLERNITKDMVVYEYGVGGSTLFFVKRVKQLISVEHDNQWFDLVEENIKKKGYMNWKGYLIKPDTFVNHPNVDPSDPDSYTSEDQEFEGKIFKSYAMSIESYPNDYFDLVLIDGRARPSWFKHSLKKIKKNGYLCWDNTERSYYMNAMTLAPLSDFKVFHFPGPTPYTGCFTKTSIWQRL